jgi:hypothetical protein
MRCQRRAGKGRCANRVARARAVPAELHELPQRGPSKFVPPMLVDLNRIWPDYTPLLPVKRQAPLSPIQNSLGRFDDKMIVVDASDRGEPRRRAPAAARSRAPHRLPARRERDRRPRRVARSKARRGLTAPFYFKDKMERAAVIGFLRSLDTSSNKTASAQR